MTRIICPVDGCNAERYRDDSGRVWPTCYACGMRSHRCFECGQPRPLTAREEGRR